MRTLKARQFFQAGTSYDLNDLDHFGSVEALKSGIRMPSRWLSKIKETLIAEVLKEISPASKILQVGSTYGSDIPKVSDRLTEDGMLDLIGIEADHLKKIKPLVAPLSNTYVSGRASDNPPQDVYDTAICLFMLYQVPDNRKRRIVNALLHRIKNGGKIIFMDYHKPARFNLFRWLMYLKNRLWHPFASSLWRSQIVSFADPVEGSSFSWQKETYFQGLYQKVTVTRNAG